MCGDSSDYKKVRKRCFLKKLTDLFFYGFAVKNLLSTFIFKSVSQDALTHKNRSMCAHWTFEERFYQL